MSERAGLAAADYPVDLAQHIADACKKWDECDGDSSDDTLLQECIDNDWHLSEYLALYLRSLPVEERMEAMGMEPAFMHGGEVITWKEQQRDQ